MYNSWCKARRGGYLDPKRRSDRRVEEEWTKSPLMCIALRMLWPKRATPDLCSTLLMSAECLRTAVRRHAVRLSPLRCTGDRKCSRLSSHRCDEMKCCANGRSKCDENRWWNYQSASRRSECSEALEGRTRWGYPRTQWMVSGLQSSTAKWTVWSSYFWFNHTKWLVSLND
jgi:hypothetical protein